MFLAKREYFYTHPFGFKWACAAIINIQKHLGTYNGSKITWAFKIQFPLAAFSNNIEREQETFWTSFSGEGERLPDPETSATIQSVASAGSDPEVKVLLNEGQGTAKQSGRGSHLRPEWGRWQPRESGLCLMPKEMLRVQAYGGGYYTHCWLSSALCEPGLGFVQNIWGKRSQGGWA